MLKFEVAFGRSKWIGEAMTKDLRSAITSLWFRLISLAIVGLVFAEVLFLTKARIQGWTFYLTTSEVVFEVVVRLIFAALAGILLGTICSLLALPFLKSSPTRALVAFAPRARKASAQ